MKNILALTVLSVAATFAAVAPAMANTITVGASTAALCTAPAAVTVALGNYNGLTAAAPQTANVVFQCTNTTPATVTLESVSTASATGGDLTDAATATPIAYTFSGDGTVVTGTGLTAGNDLTVPVVVDIAAGQNPAPGTYSDTINVTVTY
jgi:spore coat protein U-like protein